MPNINDAFPSRYLKAHELQGKQPVVTIDRVAFEAMGRSRDVVPVVYFVGKAKALKLNKTMATAIAEIAGTPLTERWTGTKLALFATSADFGTQSYPVVRVKAAARVTAAVTRPPAPQRPPILTSELDIDLADGGAR